MTKDYYLEHKKEIIEKVVKRQVAYRKTPMGRASRLVGNYNQADKKANRCQGDLTAQWLVENILFKPCAHCGKEGWDVIGCNRLDNSKPHTKDNVEPCCEECNRELYYKEHEQKVGLYSLEGKLLRVFNCMKSCEKELGITHSIISDCCNNKYLREGNNVYNGCVFRKYANN